MTEVVAPDGGNAQLVARGVRMDAKRRISLGRVVDELGDNVTFDIYRTARGELILEPRVSVPAAEAWLYRNPTALGLVRRGLDEAARGVAESVGSFADYADGE
jgi:hypothetical protein